MKPKALLSFLKEEIKYNDQILKEADFKIKKQSLTSTLTIVVCFFIPSLLVLSTWALCMFTLGLLITFLPLYLIFHKTRFFNKLKNKIDHKFNTDALFDINRSSKVREEHLNQIKLSLTLDQYKALHIKYPNPSYEDVITFLENIDSIDTTIAQAQESKYMVISTDGIKELKKERVQNIAHL